MMPPAKVQASVNPEPSEDPDHSSDEMEDDLSPHVLSFHETGDCRDRFSSESFSSLW